jgi:hypothetical protein
LVRQLGEGGMGIVYEAHQMHPIRRDVALKAGLQARDRTFGPGQTD